MDPDAEGAYRTRNRLADTPYKRWQKQEGLPIYRGSFVANLHTAEVGPWARLGQKGAFINLADQEEDGWLIEIAPGGQTEALHHAFEASIYVVDGRGATTFWQDESRKQTVEWQRGSIFSPPINAFYRHFNVDGQEAARLFAVTTRRGAVSRLPARRPRHAASGAGPRLEHPRRGDGHPLRGRGPGDLRAVRARMREARGDSADAPAELWARLSVRG